MTEKKPCRTVRWGQWPGEGHLTVPVLDDHGVVTKLVDLKDDSARPGLSVSVDEAEILAALRRDARRVLGPYADFEIRRMMPGNFGRAFAAGWFAGWSEAEAAENGWAPAIGCFVERVRGELVPHGEP